MQTSFVVLSTSGKLYLGEKGAHLKDVMDHVDAGLCSSDRQVLVYKLQVYLYCSLVVKLL